MKNYFKGKWNSFKSWFFNNVIAKYFGKQLTESILIVSEDGTLPYTVTEDYVILTLNGGGKIQISKDRFWEVIETNLPSSEPRPQEGYVRDAPAFVDVDAIEAHNEFINRGGLRKMVDVRDADSYYDKKALKKQLRTAEEKGGITHLNTKSDRLMKKRLGTKEITNEEREAFTEAKAAKLKEATTKLGQYDVVPMTDEIKSLLTGANNADEYNPEDAVQDPLKNWYKKND